MKTLDELYQEVLASEELKAELAEIKTSEALDEFFVKHDCSMTSAEIDSILAENGVDSQKLSDDELTDVAGGTSVSLVTFTIHVIESQVRDGRCTHP